MSVLVTDASGNHALAAVRSLGRRGIRVVGADCVRLAKGLYSRYCSQRVFYPSPTRGIEEFHRGLRRILKTLKPEILMPMTERTILALLADRREVESRVPLAPLPPEESIRVAFDKEATIRLAESLGVPVPRSEAPRDLHDLADLRSRISYPAVIKPRRSEIVTADGRIVPGGPADYCFAPDELEARYLAVHRRAPRPLIQEFIPGQGFGISALCERGRIKVLFAHRRLRMIRPTGSGSSLRESIPPPPDMAEAARSLLQALGWHGVAMVEFKRDARDGAPRLMEINGRFWNSVPLAVAAGVDFPYLLYRLGTKGEAPDRLGYRVGVRCRWLLGDARHLLEVLRGRPAGWADEFPSRFRAAREFMRFRDRDLHYDDLSLTDPLPFLADIGDLLLRQLPRSIFRRRDRDVIEVPDPRPLATRMSCGSSG